MQEIIQPGPSFERDVIELQKTIPEVTENRDISKTEREVVKDYLREAAIKRSSDPAASQNTNAGGSVLPQYMTSGATDEAAKQKVEKLLALALRDDLFKALALAKKADPFTEDAFHDALIDHLVPLLKKKGVLK